MKLHRVIILAIAALAGFGVYKVRTEVASDASDSSFFDNINGDGSIGETIRTANDEREQGTNNGTGNKPSPAGSKKDTSFNESMRSDSELIAASAKGNTRRVEERIAAHARIDSRDGQRRTPLMYACWNAHKDVAIRLLAAGANPELKDRSGNNAFDYAAGRGQTAMLDFLFEYTHTKDDQHYGQYAQLMRATLSSDISQLPPGKLVTINQINPEGQAPLHIAAGNGFAPLVEALIERGANVNLANGNRQTPLLWAAWNNRADAVETLLKHGASTKETDLGGNTSLIMAVQNGSVAAAKMLLKYGADKYAVNKQGKNAVIIAEDKNLSELVDLMK